MPGANHTQCNKINPPTSTLSSNFRSIFIATLKDHANSDLNGLSIPPPATHKQKHLNLTGPNLATYPRALLAHHWHPTPPNTLTHPTPSSPIPSPTILHHNRTNLTVTSDPPERATTPPRDPSPVQFVAWSPAKDPLDAEAQAAEEAEARERLWKFHQSRALHLRAAILATQYMFPQDPPQGPED
ncbi:hypothetical protein EDB87DRAFT_1835907 [Lactarius vividus]|nr:hypothetical protein EDB87DRAFT_1835907 [Lactarius vividus]